jgi:alkylhydroperoxidase family enzyme
VAPAAKSTASPTDRPAEENDVARLPYLSQEDLTDEQQHLLERPINLFRALAHGPDVLEWMKDIGSWIRYRCRLDPRLRELAIIQVGYVTRSPYEFSHHVKIGQDFGVTDADLRGLVADTQGRANALGEQERAVLRATRELVAGTELGDEAWSELRRFLPPDRILDLLFVVTHYVQVVRMLGALQIDVEDEYAPYLELLTTAGTEAGR